MSFGFVIKDMFKAYNELFSWESLTKCPMGISIEKNQYLVA